MKVKELPIANIKPYPHNPRKNEAAVEPVAASIKAFGFKVPIVLDKDGVIVAGHTRLEAAKRLGLDKVPCVVADDLTPEQVKAFRLADNKTAEMALWDVEMLADELADISEFDMKDFGFDELPAPQDGGADIKYNSLAEKYIEPPFSILDARTGKWQERKRYWINDVGIKSQESRQSLQTSGSLSGSIPNYYDKKRASEQKIGRTLTNSEFEEKYLQEMLPKDSIISSTSGGGILSIFDPVLAEVLYRWFAVPNGSILDPFAGGCVRGVMASFCGLDYTGVDIRQEQVDANVTAALNLCKEHLPAWTCGDSANIDALVPGEYDMLFSCPPYADLEKYSDNEKDISNMPYDKFLQAYRGIIKKSCAMLKENRFAVFVVGEVRGSNGAYRNFVADTIQAFIDAGLRYYNEIIFITPAGSLPLRVNSMWKTRKVGKTHQNVLVFYKGDMKKIRSIYTDESALDAITDEEKAGHSAEPPL